MLLCSKCKTENTNDVETCVTCGNKLSARDFRGVVTTTTREKSEVETTETQEQADQDKLVQARATDECPSCGQRAAPGATFCGTCGKSLTEEGAAEPASEAKRSWMTGVVKVNVRPRPDLSTDDVIDLLRKHLGYEVYKTPSWRGRQIMVRRSATVGVAVDIKHKQDATSFVVGGTMPSDALNFLMRASFALVFVTFGLWGLILRLFLPTEEWKAMEGEVSESLQKNIGL